LAPSNRKSFGYTSYNIPAIVPAIPAITLLGGLSCPWQNDADGGVCSRIAGE